MPLPLRLLCGTRCRVFCGRSLMLLLLRPLMLRLLRGIGAASSAAAFGI